MLKQALGAFVISVMLVTTGAHATTCNAFETKVDDLARVAEGYRTSAEFKQFGYGRGGRFFAEMQRANELNGSSESASFMGKHGFAPGHIPQIALDYRSDGGPKTDLSKQIDRSIRKFRCD